MNKRTLHHRLRFARRIPIWTFAVCMILFAFVALAALRANNQRMIELRQAVFVADEQDGDIESALRDLREYVYAHMNTDLASGDNAIRPPIQLKYRYERLVAAEEERLQTAAGNQNLYTQAQEYCETQHSDAFLGRDKLPCIREYLDKHGVAAVEEEIYIPDDMYKFDFVSPRWSPDLAGWSIVFMIGSGVLFAAHMSSLYILKRLS